ncbi:MAG: hypothetical protein K6U80_19360 [Firmicutes bacterium]|nr:hypothetical protein [Bacillota bacterium]
MSNSKPLLSIAPDELEKGQVWEYDLDNEAGQDETYVFPIKTLPVDSLDNRVAVSKVKLKNGQAYISILGNIDLKNIESTREFLTLSLNSNGKWFHLARYHDFDYQKNGPEALAKFLSLEVDDVFPISYDISKLAQGKNEVLKGTIPKAPLKILSKEERRNLIFGK